MVPSVNKQSLREEFTALKERFGQLSSDDDESALSHAGTHTKGKAYDPSRSANTRTVESVEVSKVSACEECGEDLPTVRPHGHERRTQIDIVFEKVLSHVDAEIKSCPHCGSETRAPFPETFAGPVQYGSGIKAYALNLAVAQMISLKRVQQSIQTLIGLAICEATILKYVLQLHLALARWEQMAIDRILIQPTMHVDETSIRVHKHNHWIHVCSAGDITLKFVHEKRGLEAMTAIGIIPIYGGVIVHDCWASYLSYEHCGHGLCGAHLLPELTFIVEANGYAWAGNIKRLLQQTCSRVFRRKRERLSPREYQRL